MLKSIFQKKIRQRLIDFRQIIVTYISYNRSFVLITHKRLIHFVYFMNKKKWLACQICLNDLGIFRYIFFATQNCYKRDDFVGKLIF